MEVGDIISLVASLTGVEALAGQTSVTFDPDQVLSCEQPEVELPAGSYRVNVQWQIRGVTKGLANITIRAQAGELHQQALWRVQVN